MPWPAARAMAERLRPRTVLILIGVLLIGLVGVRTVASAWVLRQEAIDDWRKDLGNLALILSENTAQSMTAAELVLASVAEDIGTPEPATLASAFGGKATQDNLRHKIGGVPQIDVATIVAADGTVVAFTRAWPAPPISLADRDYFAFHRSHPGTGAHLSAPVQNKGNGKWTFYLSRRIDNRQGEFAGIVLIGLSCDFFSDFFRRTTIDPGATLSLYRSDAILVARWPEAPQRMGQPIAGGASDGQRGTLGAVHAVRGQPLAISVSVTDAVYLASWWRMLGGMGGAALANLAVLILALMAMAALLRRRERDAARALQLQTEAEAANAAKSRFLALISHEIRTPLAGIGGMAELLMASPLDPTQRGQVEQASHGVANLTRILNDILDLSRVEAGRMPIVPVDFDARRLVHETIALFNAQAAKKGLLITAAIDPAVAAALHADAARIVQVLGNLLSNAIKFTAAGTIHVTLAPGADAGALAFAVQDTGIGMTPAQRARLFEAYAQGDDQISGLYGGTGLGLAICKHLVELMGGTITCTSTAGAGALFAFSVATTPARGHAPVAAAPVAAAPGRILLVDDTLMNRQLACLQLARRGHHVDAVENGALAVAALERERYDLVLMDCMMPVMDGYAACRALRANEARLGLPATPVVALTAGGADDDRARCAAAGMDDYLAKPFRADQLTALVDHWLALR
jgi:signal transduction histidine kinase